MTAIHDVAMRVARPVRGCATDEQYRDLLEGIEGLLNLTLAAALLDRMRLLEAVKPFVAAYRKAEEPIGDSDLDNEQPRSVSVTLGDCRRAAATLHNVENPS
jgi:hypothetical protein